MWTNVVAFPTRPAADVPTELPAQVGGHQAAGLPVGVRTRPIRGVVVLTVEGRLDDIVEDLCWAIQLALAEGPGAWSAACRGCSRVVSRPRLRCSPRPGAMSATVRDRILNGGRADWAAGLYHCPRWLSG